MTLEIKVTDLELFTKVLNATATVLEDEGTFVITPDGGITLRNMDKPRFAMVDLKIAPVYYFVLNVHWTGEINKHMDNLFIYQFTVEKV